MSLMSKVDALKAKAEQDGANELDLMRAALVESQERYNQQAAQISLMLQRYDKRIEALEKAVEQSNEQKSINVSTALKRASETILRDLKSKVDSYGTEIENNITKMKDIQQEATQQEKSTEREIFAIIVASVLVAAFVGGYIANVLWGAWNDIPAKLDAINNAAYTYTKSITK